MSGRSLTLLRLAVALAIAAGLAWTFSFTRGPRRAPRAPAAEGGSPARAPTGPDLLAGIGYAEVAEPEADGSAPAGVVRHLEGRATPGLRLFTPGTVNEARLMTLDGERVHTWAASDDHVRQGEWQHVELLSDGDLLVVCPFQTLERYDWNSRLIWRAEVPVHHDFDLDARGRIVTLTANPRLIERDGETLPVLDNAIAVFEPEDGTLARSVLLSELFDGHPHYEAMYFERRVELLRDYLEQHPEDWAAGMVSDPKGFQDVFHANSIEVLERDVHGVARAGDLLISVRELSLLAFVRLDPPELLATIGEGELQSQHHASLLPDGRVLVLDNGILRGWSRVLELDPRNGFVLRRYGEEPEARFYSKRRSGVQSTGRGGYLVTESGRGRGFEVDRAGEIVWEYFCPPEPDGHRRPVYRYSNVPPEVARTLPFEPPLTAEQLGLGTEPR